MSRNGMTPTMLTKDTPMALQKPKLAIIASPAANMPPNPSIIRCPTLSHLKMGGNNQLLRLPGINRNYMNRSGLAAMDMFR